MTAQTIDLNLAGVHTKRQFDHVLDNAIPFEGWHDQRLNDWIGTTTFGSSADPRSRFFATERPSFVFDLGRHGVTEIDRDVLSWLIDTILAINVRSTELAGHSLVSLQLA